MWALAFVLCARAAAAQSPAPAPATDPNPGGDAQFMPRASFHLTAEHLSGDDPAYVWDANFGGEFDIVDYGDGRATFVANYQAILGEQIRRFDPNQGNYILAGSASLRHSSGYEIAIVFHHESRHLSDRATRIAIAWNMAGGRIGRTWVVGLRRTEMHVDLRKTLARAFVDYTWELDSAVRNDVQVHPHVRFFGAGGLRRLWVDGNQNRGAQTGYRIEGGVHLTGIVGGMEFFLANERRVDPYPLAFGTVNWVTAGFRLLSR